MIHFKKYHLTGSTNNYFTIEDPLYIDSLTITELYEIPKLRKQNNNIDNLLSLEFGDLDIRLSLITDEVSAGGSTVEEFFAVDEDAFWLCIIDTGNTKWAGMVFLPIEFNKTYPKGDMFVNVKAVHIFAELKKFMEKLVLQAIYPVDQSIRWNTFVGSYLFNNMYLNIINNFNPASSSFVLGLKLSIPLYNKIVGDPQNPRVGARDGNTITKYDFFKQLSLIWGIIWTIAVPETYLTDTRPVLTLTLSKRAATGTLFTPEWLEYNYRVLPNAKKWVFVKQEEYEINIPVLAQPGQGLDGNTFRVARGILFNLSDNYIYSHNLFGTAFYSEPFFVLQVTGNGNKDIPNGVERPDCIGKLTIVDSIPETYIVPTDYLQIPNDEIYFINSREELYEMSAPFNSGYFSQYSNDVVIKISIDRLWVFSYTYIYTNVGAGLEHYTDNYTNIIYTGAADTIINELKVLLKTRRVAYGQLRTATYEPDLNDRFQIDSDMFSIYNMENDLQINSGTAFTTEFEAIQCQ